MNTDRMTKDEKSILLYLESCATDDIGRIDSRKINDIDLEIMKKWNKSGFISFGRLRSADIKSGSFKATWVKLSDEAWETAFKLRKERALRMEKNYPYERKEIGVL